MTTLAQLEQLRRSVKNLLILNLIIFLVGLFLPLVFKILFTLASGVFYLAVVMNKHKQYKQWFKSDLVKASLEGIFTQLAYQPDQGVEIEQVRASQIVELRDEYTSNDLIIAKYGDVKFKQADITVSAKSRVVGPNGIAREDTQPCFVGRFLEFNFLKPTPVPVLVLGKHFSAAGKSGALEGLKNRFDELFSKQRVSMESELFNSHFTAFCEDAQTAFYILTPPIIQAITRLSTQYQDRIAISFTGEKMYVAVNSKRDSLEPRIFSSRSIDEEKELVLKDIRVITDFIEYMNLENNILVTAAPIQ